MLNVIQIFSPVQSLSGIQFFATPWTAARQSSLSITNTQSLLKLMSIELVMPSNHLILCHPLLLLPSIFSRIRVFSNKSVLCIRCPKFWSFSFSISPSNEYSGLISFRIDWFYLLAVQGTLKSLLQHHSSKESMTSNIVFPEFWTSLVAQMVKQLPTMQETQVWSLGWDNPLEKEMATHSSILTWKIPWTENPVRLQSMGSQRVRHNCATSLHFTSLNLALC